MMAIYLPGVVGPNLGGVVGPTSGEILDSGPNLGEVVDPTLGGPKFEGVGGGVGPNLGGVGDLGGVLSDVNNCLGNGGDRRLGVQTRCAC